MFIKRLFRYHSIVFMITLLALGFLYSFLPIPTAEAHASLLDMTPAEKVVTEESPATLKLHFNEPIDKELASVTIYDWHAKPVFSGRPDSEKERSTVMKFPLPKLKQGSYTVKWQVISLDGHPVTGSYTFAIGEATKNGIKSVNKNDDSITLFIIIRAMIQGLLLISAGLYVFSRLAGRKRYPFLGKLLKKRYIVFPVLFAGTLIELAAYCLSLPSGLIQTIIGGRWELLQQFPFIIMLLVQLLVLILLVIPDMVQPWYIVLWLILAVSPAFGGHVWGMAHPVAALIPRIIHELSIAIWLGALLYVILLIHWNRNKEHDKVSWKHFRSFFVLKMMTVSSMVVLSGIVMVYMQTGWTALFTEWMPWNKMLMIKLALTLLMLGIAGYQTLKWRARQTFSTNRLIRSEWLIGLIIIIFGVWMSQSAYPIPVKTYEKTLIIDQQQAHVHIAKLQAGDQEMTVEIPQSAKKNAIHVAVKMFMPEHDMQSGPLAAKKTESGKYHIKLPFTMAGNWHVDIRATYPDGTAHTWTAKLFVIRAN